MSELHPIPASGAHARTQARTHAPVRCTRTESALSPDELELVERARQDRAEAEDLERRARDARARLGATLTTLVDRGITKRALARLLKYASDNSVRVKTARNG